MKTYNVHNLSIAALAPREESRFSINGIHLADGHSEVTDGHLLMRVECPRLEAETFPAPPDCAVSDKPAVLPIDGAAALVKAIKGAGRTSIPVLKTVAVLSNGAVGEDGKPLRYVVANDLESVTKKPVDPQSKWPDTSRVMPADDPADIEFCLDAHLLARLVRQFSDMGPKKDAAHVVFRIRGDKQLAAKSVVKITGKTAESQAVIALIMPCRMPQ